MDKARIEKNIRDVQIETYYMTVEQLIMCNEFKKAYYQGIFLKIVFRNKISINKNTKANRAKI